MRPQFSVYSDLEGNLHVVDGVVIDAATGAIFRLSADTEFGVDVPGDSYREIGRVAELTGAEFSGGSGRNLLCSGGGAGLPNGFFRPEIADAWRNGGFYLEVTGPSAATISDATDVVAVLTTGGTAPVGNYDSTTYGHDTYAASVPFVLAIAAEDGGPGAVPDASVEIHAGTAVGGDFTPVDASNYVSAVDPDWTIALQASGDGWLKHLSDTVAIRTGGTAFDPAGYYEAVEAAYFYHPVVPDDDEALDLAEVNPFGILTITYAWPATPDLDNTTTFLGETVGYPGPYSGTYMTHSGDDTSAAGSEVVTIDLGAAWIAGDIETVADVLCAADWYPPSGGSGPATLDISYSLGGSLSLTINPGVSATPATTFVRAIRVLADGSLSSPDDAWAATVRRIPQPTREGVVYVSITEAAGAVTAATGPHFATAMPASGSGVFNIPIALSDGAGLVEQIVTGAIIWRVP